MKKLFVSISLLATTLLLVTGCKSAKLKNGEEKVVGFDGGKVTADTLYKSLKDKYGILHATRGLGNIYAIQDDEDSALTYYQTSLAIAQSINDSIWQTAILCDIAKFMII